MNKLIVTVLASVFVVASSSTALAEHHYYNGQHYGDGHDYARCGQFDSEHRMPRGFSEADKLEATTIAEIKKNAKDDQIVKVKGKLTKYLGDEAFEFTDANQDSITVILDDDRNWAYLAKDMPTEIIAEVDKGKMDIVLEVKAARPDFQRRPRTDNTAPTTDTTY